MRYSEHRFEGFENGDDDGEIFLSVMNDLIENMIKIGFEVEIFERNFDVFVF